MNQFDLALDDCLQQLGSGRASMGQCLSRYPQFAAELRPLLETALRCQRGKDLRPSGAARDRGRAKLAQHMQSHPRQSRNIKSVPRLAFAMLAVLLALLVAGTAYAQTALPGQALYPLKLSTEQAWRAASPDPLDVDLRLADRRADELVQLATIQRHAARDDQQIELAESEGISAYNDVLLRLENEAKGPKGDAVIKVLQAHQKKFSEAGVSVPELENIISHGASGSGQGNGSTRP